MNAPRSPKSPTVRRNGWTAERQLRFLDALASCSNVARAAASVGMSREGAYRFRNRRGGALFAALWDRALAPEAAAHKVHTPPPTDGHIMRLLGTHYWRNAGLF
jgi:hypothetical protein